MTVYSWFDDIKDGQLATMHAEQCNVKSVN
jgi:hypothetical protein